MLVKTIHADTLKEFKQKYINSINDDFHPNAAQVFASVSFDLNAVVSFLGSMKIRIFGCSSCGEFVYNEKDQVISEGAIVCLLMEILPESFEIKLFHGNSFTSFELGTQIGTWVKRIYQDPAILILASGLQTDGEQLVRGIQEKAGENITMYGGLAGDDAKFNETFVFSEEEIENKGAIVMTFNKEIYEINGIATSGWVGIGADKIITHADGNVVYTIDGHPALDVYKEYLNVSDDDLPEIGVEYPLLIKKQGCPDVLRAVINLDRELKALIFAGSVPQGSIVSFSSSPGFEIIELTRKKINEFRQHVQNTDLLILFSCMARHNALGPTISEEMEEAWEQWKTPLIGFFTYGEIGNHYNAVCDFYNETFTLVSIKQKT